MISRDELLRYDDGVYRTAPSTVSWFARTFPTFNFYRRFAWNVYRSSRRARRGEYGDLEWSQTSHQVLQSLEAVGVRAEFSGLEQIRQLQSPCVFVGNHMSMFETMVLPAIIQPIRGHLRGQAKPARLPRLSPRGAYQKSDRRLA